MNDQPPAFPAGEFVEPQEFDANQQFKWLLQLREVPDQARQAIEGLDKSQLDTKYRNWTIRQIIHHLADSHLNSYVRFKWALTEQEPTIKAYDETLWSEAKDARFAPIESSLNLLDGLHDRWGQMIEQLSAEEMQRGFFHPELDKVVYLWQALPAYVWHSNHHLSQIRWVREQQGW